MAMIHTCERFGCQFKIDNKVRVNTGWGRSIQAGFRPLAQQLEDYQKVICPECGFVEKDDRILSYGLFKPQTVIYIVLVIMFVLLAVDLIR